VSNIFWTYAIVSGVFGLIAYKVVLYFENKKQYLTAMLITLGLISLSMIVFLIIIEHLGKVNL